MGVRANLLGSAGLSDSDTDTQDGISTELALVGGTVELDEEIVDILLFGYIETGLDECRADGIVDVLNGVEDT